MYVGKTFEVIASSQCIVSTEEPLFEKFIGGKTSVLYQKFAKIVKLFSCISYVGYGTYVYCTLTCMHNIST